MELKEVFPLLCVLEKTKRISGFLSHAVFSLFNNIFPERSYPKQTGSIPTSPNAWRHQKNFGVNCSSKVLLYRI
jgi:hypothetical protein